MEDLKTKRLYYVDPYRTEFEAHVVKRTNHEEKPAVILDQTCFYPESGGQPADKGTINELPVTHVLEQGAQILHVLENEFPGEKARGRVDWSTRFDHMQQHSGQHILSQSFFELFKGETRSFHLGKDVSTLEIALPTITEKDVETVELRANEIVFQDKEIKSYFVDEGEIEKTPLRRPPKKSGRIRVVEVDQYDYSACGGTHPQRTGEIGLIKILKWEKIRGNLRFEFVCGRRAVKDYTMRNRILRQLAVRFTVSEPEVFFSVEKLFDEKKEQKKQLKKMRENLVCYEAKDLMSDSSGPVFKRIFSDREVDEVRLLALNIVKQGSYLVLFGLRRETRAHLLFTCSDDLDLDLRELVPEVSPIINGKGGGRPSLVEMAGDNIDKVDEAVNAAEIYLRKKTGIKIFE